MDEAAFTEETPAIPYIDPETLDPETKALFDRIGSAIGFVPNSMRTYLHRPQIAAALMGLSSAVYAQDEGALPLEIQSKLGVVCSAINGCAYCSSHQCDAVQNPAAMSVDGKGLSDEDVTALISGEYNGESPAEQAALAYARAASLDPNAVSDDILADLRANLTPAQIVQLAATVGLWKLFNTIHDSLHLPIEDKKLPFRRLFDESRNR